MVNAAHHEHSYIFSGKLARLSFGVVMGGKSLTVGATGAAPLPMWVGSTAKRLAAAGV